MDILNTRRSELPLLLGSDNHDRGHSHGVDRTNERRILWALLLTGSFMVVELLGLPMLVVAAVGLAVNLIAFAILHGGAKRSMNVLLNGAPDWIDEAVLNPALFEAVPQVR